MPPPADQIHSLINFPQQHPDILWVVLPVRVHRNHDFSFSGAKARSKRRGLSEISSKLNHHDRRVGSLQRGQYLQRPVCAAIIYEDDLIGPPGIFKSRQSVPGQWLQIVRLVKDREDD